MKRRAVSFCRICSFNPLISHPWLQRTCRCRCSIYIARLEFSRTNYRFARLSNRLEKMNLAWIHPMHRGSFEQNALPNYGGALRENEFAYRGMLLGREIA